MTARLRQLDARWWGPALAYALVCGLLWPIPVFGLLHAESSAVIAAAAFFVTGLAAIPAFRQLEPLRAVLSRHLVLLVVPLALLTVSMLWRPNCAYGVGLGIFGLLVPPSAILGVALAYALTSGSLGWPRATLVAIGLAVAVGGVVADLGFHPQLFTYNHVFGGVLGPIYDEELALRPGLFAFRGQTLLWAIGLVLVGRARRVTGHERRSQIRMAVGVCGFIGVTYLFAVPLGIQQSHRSLAAALGARSDVGRFEIYYDADTLEPEALRRIEDELLYRYHQIEESLSIEPSQPIRVYLYPDAETKGRLIGSRETSVVPVWLSVPQVHMLVDQVSRSAGHELVHVFAREFGMPGLRASPAVGLVEGLAVALEPPDGFPTPTDLVLAAQQANVAAQGLEQDPAEMARATMDPIGFWTTRAGVAYTTSGAFVRWLLDEHGPEPFRAAYRSGNVERAYGQSLSDLSESWAASLQGKAPSRQAIELAEDLLTRRSLFERACPHYVPAFVRDARSGAEALESGEVARAQRASASSLQAEPTYEFALAGWAAAIGASGTMLSRDSLRRMEATALDSLAGPGSALALADLHRIAGREADAGRLYAEALARTPSYAPLASALTRIRGELSPAALRAVMQSPDDPARAAGASGDLAPVHAALLWDRAGDPVRAWSLAQRWDLDALAKTPVDRAALDGLQARLAYLAGALATSDSLASASARAYRQQAHVGPAAFADDWADRARWRSTFSSDPRRGRSPE
ncbi:MAG: hypothetical protein Rubg2KO_19450 [Rubricoccaceae bacterium]